MSSNSLIRNLKNKKPVGITVQLYIILYIIILLGQYLCRLTNNAINKLKQTKKWFLFNSYTVLAPRI